MSILMDIEDSVCSQVLRSVAVESQHASYLKISLSMDTDDSVPLTRTWFEITLSSHTARIGDHVSWTEVVLTFASCQVALVCIKCW